MTNVTLLRVNDFQVSDWSGGKTKQLYLSPPTGHYSKRDFDYRLSTATVELAESQFSDLSGFHRILMSLDQTLHLHNASRESIVKVPLAIVARWRGKIKLLRLSP